jgi:hypothetical protein
MCFCLQFYVLLQLGLSGIVTSRYGLYFVGEHGKVMEFALLSAL